MIIRLSPEQRPEFELIVERIRSERLSPLLPQLKAIGQPNFSVTSYDRIDDRIDPEGSLVGGAIRERHTMTLSGVPGTEHLAGESVLTIAWTNLPVTQTIPVSILRVHPLQLVQDTIFLGYLRPDERHVVTLRISNPDLFRSAFGGAALTDRSCTVTIDDQAHTLTLTLVVPGRLGRFTDSLVLNCNDDFAARYPPLRIDLSGIVSLKE
jgi:hypothetical protein